MILRSKSPMMSPDTPGRHQAPDPPVANRTRAALLVGRRAETGDLNPITITIAIGIRHSRIGTVYYLSTICKPISVSVCYRRICAASSSAQSSTRRYLRRGWVHMQAADSRRRLTAHVVHP